MGISGDRIEERYYTEMLREKTGPYEGISKF
jgi:hypothetical protein